MMFNLCSKSSNSSNHSYDTRSKNPFVSLVVSNSHRLPHFASSQAKSLTKHLALCCALAVPAFSASMAVGVSPAHAVCDPATGALTGTNDIVVCSGDTTNQDAPNGYGVGGSTRDIESLTVERGATVTGTNAGIDIDNVTLLTNFGTIRVVAGGNEEGVHAVGTIGTLINIGDIIGGAEEGVQANTIGTLTNSGTITGDEDGVRATLTIGTLTNSGTIAGDFGVFANTINSFTNSGTINGNTAGVRGGTITALINSGTISSRINGVQATDLTSLINSGTISSSTDDGVDATRLVSLVNSGIISGVARAIHSADLSVGAASDTTLTLNAGSVLIGAVELGGGTNTVNIGAGLSLNSTFEDPDAGSVAPVLGATGGHLTAILDQAAGAGTNRQIVAVDPSAFASFDDALAALVSGIGQTVQSRQAALRSDPALGFSSSFASRFAAAEEASLSAFSDLDLEDTPHLNPSRFWVEGFGAYRQGQSDKVGGDFDSLTGGLVAGVDVPVDALTNVGVMAGFAASTSENEIDTQQTDTMSYYAGVYASTQALGLAWDASLTAGYSDYSQERVTANNLVATGLETASADFGGWFINPQVTITREDSNPLAGIGFGALMGTQTLEQSLTLSYAGLFLDGYTETGTTNPLTLDDRSIHIASARAALALPFEAIHADGALTTLRLIGGVEARTPFGDNGVSGTLLAQTVSTTLDDGDAVLGGFLGLSGEYQTTTGLTVYANAEALLETNSAYQISAAAGLRIAF